MVQDLRQWDFKYFNCIEAKESALLVSSMIFFEKSAPRPFQKKIIPRFSNVKESDRLL